MRKWGLGKSGDPFRNRLSKYGRGVSVVLVAVRMGFPADRSADDRDGTVAGHPRPLHRPGTRATTLRDLWGASGEYRRFSKRNRPRWRRGARAGRRGCAGAGDWYDTRREPYPGSTERPRGRSTIRPGTADLYGSANTANSRRARAASASLRPAWRACSSSRRASSGLPSRLRSMPRWR